MFDKIGQYAETVAASAGQSRRGFLGRLGRAALVGAGVVGALFLLPREARAGTCFYVCPDGKAVFRDCPCPPTITHGGMTCTLGNHNCGY